LETDDDDAFIRMCMYANSVYVCEDRSCLIEKVVVVKVVTSDYFI